MGKSNVGLDKVADEIIRTRESDSRRLAFTELSWARGDASGCTEWLEPEPA